MTEEFIVVRGSANFWVISSVVTPILTFGISYPLAIFEGNIPKPRGTAYPSDSIDEWPDRAIGTFGLGFSAWCLSHFFYCHWLFLSVRLPEWRRSSLALLILGEIGSFFVFGIGAIQTGISPFWHSFFAYNTFALFNIYVGISTLFMDRLIEKKDLSYQRGWLRFCSGIGGPIMFIILIFPGVHGIYSSLAEIGLLLCFFCWIATHYNVLGRIYITYANDPSWLNACKEFEFGDALVKRNRECPALRISDTVEKYGSNTRCPTLSKGFNKLEDGLPAKISEKNSISIRKPKMKPSGTVRTVPSAFQKKSIKYLIFS